jgi:starch-binding outer membrane protein, SusD/RagB family
MKNYKYLTLALIILAIASCKKTIDLYPESNTYASAYYSTMDEVSVALTGCYNGMQKTLTEEWTLTELRSDNSIQGVPASTASTNRDLSDLDMFMPNTSHQGNFSYWSSVYYNIRNINLVLNALNVNYSPTSGTISYDTLLIPGTNATRRSLAAEAMFIRAYHYFNLVRLYGGVFLVHEPLAAEDAKAINRSSVAEMYKLIEADLTNAIANGNQAKFTAGASTLGRANAWSAKALLAKVYLTQNKKTEAAALLQDVITNSGYALQPSYGSIFSITNEMSSEVLFAIRFKAGGLGLGSPFPNLFAPLSSGSAVVNGDGRGLNYPSTDMMNSYYNAVMTNSSVKKDSARVVLSSINTNLQAGMVVTGTQIPAGTTINSVTGNVIVLSANATATSTTASLTFAEPRRTASVATFTGGKNYPLKLISNPSVASDAENDWMTIRYADVLLMMAEAQGNTSSSLGFMNQVRARAAIPAILPTAVTTIAQFEDSLQRERRLEFAFENQRWFDLTRYATTLTSINPVTLMQAHFAKEYPTHYGLYPAPRLSLVEIQGNINTNKLLLPIPQREIDNNTQLVIPQNPGY